MRRLVVGLTALLAGAGLHSVAIAQGTGEGEGAIIAPELSIGWLDDPSGSDWTLRRQASTGKASWQRSGWWLEARTGLKLGSSRDLLLSAGWFLARPASGDWRSHPGSSVVTLNVPSCQWGTVDVLFRYRAMQGHLDVLSGIRWDKKKARVKFSDNTEDDYSLNTYALILGLQFNQPAAGGVLSVGVLGSPLVIGQMKYKYRTDPGGYEEYGYFSLNQGYLIECRAQYTHPVGNRLKIGGFAQWGTQQVQSKEAALSGTTSEPVSWKVTHQAWTLGVIASLNFGRHF